jgi:hypothetical protein
MVRQLLQCQNAGPARLDLAQTNAEEPLNLIHQDLQQLLKAMHEAGYFSSTSMLLDDEQRHGCPSGVSSNTTSLEDDCIQSLASSAESLAGSCERLLCEASCTRTNAVPSETSTPQRRLQQTAYDASVEEQFFSFPRALICCNGLPCEEQQMCRGIGTSCSSDDSGQDQSDMCQVRAGVLQYMYAAKVAKHTAWLQLRHMLCCTACRISHVLSSSLAMTLQIAMVSHDSVPLFLCSKEAICSRQLLSIAGAAADG